MRLGCAFGGGRRTRRNQILKEHVSHVMHLIFHAEQDKTPLKYSKWESDTVRFILQILFYQNVGNGLEVGKSKGMETM